MTVPVPDTEPRRVNDRSLLETNTQSRCNALLQRAEQAGLPCLLLETVRSRQRQAWLYALGRTLPGKRVTNARPGETWHDEEVRRAFDVVLLDEHGRPWWDAPDDKWNALGRIGKSLNLTWGGDFPGIRDLGHFQYDRLTVDDAKSITAAHQMSLVIGALRLQLNEARKVLDRLFPTDNKGLLN